MGALWFFWLSILIVVISFQRILDDPDIPLLVSEKGAYWIRFREPSELKSRQSQILTTYFARGSLLKSYSGSTVHLPSHEAGGCVAGRPNHFCS